MIFPFLPWLRLYDFIIANKGGKYLEYLNLRQVLTYTYANAARELKNNQSNLMEIGFAGNDIPAKSFCRARWYPLPSTAPA
jgi:hypothetical protein